MRALRIHVEANRVTCGNCTHLFNIDGDKSRCLLFGPDLRRTSRGVARPDVCLKAEAMA